MPQRISGVYIIENTHNSHLYVGSSSNIEKRWKNHLWELKHGNHHSPYLQNAYNKYGIEAFDFRIVEEVPPDASLLCQREQYWVDTLHPQYNVCPVAGSQLGIIHPPERRQKQAQGMKMAWDRKTEEERKAFSEKASLRRHSEETKQKLAVQRRGMKQSAELVEKRVAPLRGRNRPEEVGRKSAEGNKAFWASLSEEERQARIAKRKAAKGPISEETRQKMRTAKLGKKQDPEVARKRGESTRGIKRSEETLARMRATQQRLAAEKRALNPKPPKEYRISEETRRRMSEGKKASWDKKKAQQQLNITQEPLF